MVRLAQLSDIENLLIIGEKYHRSIPHKSMPFDKEKTREWVTKCLPVRKEWLFLISEKDGEPTGMLVAMIAPTFFSTESRSYELVWHSLKGHTASKDHLKLFDVYCYWAEKAGCRHIGSSHLYGDERVGKYYKKKGFEPLEVSYIKVLNGH